MFSRFFIDRPIFAAVLSIFIVLAGLAAMRVQEAVYEAARRGATIRL